MTSGEPVFCQVPEALDSIRIALFYGIFISTWCYFLIWLLHGALNLRALCTDKKTNSTFGKTFSESLNVERNFMSAFSEGAIPSNNPTQHLHSAFRYRNRLSLHSSTRAFMDLCRPNYFANIHRRRLGVQRQRLNAIASNI